MSNSFDEKNIRNKEIDIESVISHDKNIDDGTQVEDKKEYWDRKLTKKDKFLLVVLFFVFIALICAALFGFGQLNLTIKEGETDAPITSYDVIINEISSTSNYYVNGASNTIDAMLMEGQTLEEYSETAFESVIKVYENLELMPGLYKDVYISENGNYYILSGVEFIELDEMSISFSDRMSVRDENGYLTYYLATDEDTSIYLKLKEYAEIAKENDLPYLIINGFIVGGDNVYDDEPTSSGDVYTYINIIPLLQTINLDYSFGDGDDGMIMTIEYNDKEYIIKSNGSINNYSIDGGGWTYTEGSDNLMNWSSVCHYSKYVYENDDDEYPSEVYLELSLLNTILGWKIEGNNEQLEITTDELDVPSIIDTFGYYGAKLTVDDIYNALGIGESSEITNSLMSDVDVDLYEAYIS